MTTPYPIDYTLFGTMLGPPYQEKWFQDYWESLAIHCANVRQAGRTLGVPEVQLMTHDMSKLSLEELPFYARQFFGDRGDPQGWASAWLHHQNHNPHHWEYWIMRSGHNREESGANIVTGCLEMPNNYMREMVADWIGASKTYSDDWSIREWWEEKHGSMWLHPKTRDAIVKLLREIKYGEKMG